MDPKERERWESYFRAALSGLSAHMRGGSSEILAAVRAARLVADAAVREAPGGPPSFSGSDAAVLLRFLRKLPGLDGLGEREEPILDALLAIAEDA